LRHALRSHISYIDGYSDSFVAFVRGDLGSDPEQQSAMQNLRWLGAQRILLALGIVELAVAALASTLLTVTLLDESVALSGAIMKELNTFATRSVVR